jgi:hypothetical protein
MTTRPAIRTAEHAERFLVQVPPGFVFSRVQIVTADQPHEFLRMHLVAVRSRSILLRHRTLGAAIGSLNALLRKLGRPRAHV